jgi:hypothetical protein
MPKVWTFFYGSFINLEILRGIGFTPGRHEVARLGGFDIRIRPLANLIRSGQHSVYGIVAPATHDELRLLYDHARDSLGGTYLPEPVLVELLDGGWRAALCYIDPEPDDRPASDDYIDRIVRPVKDYGFPDWYIARIEGFRPSGGPSA